MPRTCTICTHKKQGEINSALVGGGAYRHIASHYRLSTGALQRHKADHLPEHLAQATAAEAVTNADDLLAKVAAIEREAQRLAKKAEDAGDLRTAMSGIRELARLIELLARLRGELSDAPVINLVASPEWHQLRRRIADTLAPFPEAKLAMIEALHRAGGLEAPAVGIPALRLTTH